MRYLSSISLALIVHVLLSIVGLMILACASTPAATPTPSGPMYSEEEAMAILKEHLQTKILPGEEAPCLLAIEDSIRNPDSVTWFARYDSEGHRWDVTAKKDSPSARTRQGTPLPSTKFYKWSVYERTKSIVATGDEPLNQVC